DRVDLQLPQVVGLATCELATEDEGIAGVDFRGVAVQVDEAAVVEPRVVVARARPRGVEVRPGGGVERRIELEGPEGVVGGGAAGRAAPTEDEHAPALRVVERRVPAPRAGAFSAGRGDLNPFVFADCGIRIVIKTPNVVGDNILA